MSQTDGAARCRMPRARSYLMCPPDHFAVNYAINPCMDPAVGVDAARALAKWRSLRDTRSAAHLSCDREGAGHGS